MFIGIQTDPDSQRLLQVHILPQNYIHWNALPSNIPTIPTLAQFSNAVYQVIHASPLIPTPGFIFYIY